MIASLYECFQHWAKTGSVFIISDTHFCDADCKLMDKNWISADEQVEIINKKVHKADTLIILGDVGNVEYVRKLKASYKVLIMGNHDSGSENFYKKYSLQQFNEETRSWESLENYTSRLKNDLDIFMNSHSTKHYRIINNNLFDEVYEGPLFISEKIMLSHEPYDLPFAANIHGHDHAGKMYHGHNVNLASNVCGFTPVSLAELIKGGLISKVPTIHRICIDKANKNPIHKKENK